MTDQEKTETAEEIAARMHLRQKAFVLSSDKARELEQDDAFHVVRLSDAYAAITSAVEQAIAGEREMVEEGHKLLGSFFEALKPLNLQMIDVQNPGSHVTNLITERDIAQSEVERLQADLATAQFHTAEHKRLMLELNQILHPNGDGPTNPSTCDLVAYVRADLAAARAAGITEEREACADLAERPYSDAVAVLGNWEPSAVGRAIAAAIRSRTAKGEPE